MSYLDTLGKYHVALDGIGLILQGAPASPAYRMSNAPVYGTRFASGDRDYNDLSQWWYLIQTDWASGLKENTSFLDDQKFYYSSNIDARTRPGTIQLEKQLTQVYDNNVGGNDEILHATVLTVNGNQRDTLLTNDGTRSFSGTLQYSGANRQAFAHRDYFWGSAFGFVGNSISTVYPVSLTDQTLFIQSVIAGTIVDASFVSVGNTLFIIGSVNNGTLFCVKTTVQNPSSSAHYTLVFQIPQHNNLGASVVGAEVLGGDIIFLVEGSPLWALYSLDIVSGIATMLYEFDNCEQNGVFGGGARFLRKFGINTLLITVKKKSSTDEGAGEIWTYNGSNLTQVYSTDTAKKDFSTLEAIGHLQSGCTIYGDYAFWGNLVMDSSGNFFNFIKTFSDSSVRQCTPVGENGQVMYMVDDEPVSDDIQTYLYSYNHRGTSYKDGANNEAFLIFNQHDKLQSIDKLVNQITIGFNKFLSGQAIAIYYSTNPIPDPNIVTGGWVLLGTASHTLDGADTISKVFNFPIGTTAKKIWFRVQLSSGGTNTPSMNDFTLEYLPIPDFKKEWDIRVNCGDEVKTLAGNLVDKTGRELKSTLERMWWTKSALDFQDLDYATTKVNGSLSASATTIPVTTGQAGNFPEQGRIRIDDEEILYLNRNESQFLQCIRGARGTRAATHDHAATVNNAYKVLVMSLDETAPILLEDKNLEYVVSLNLREV